MGHFELHGNAINRVLLFEILKLDMSQLMEYSEYEIDRFSMLFVDVIESVYCVKSGNLRYGVVCGLWFSKCTVVAKALNRYFIIT